MSPPYEPPITATVDGQLRFDPKSARYTGTPTPSLRCSSKTSRTTIFWISVIGSERAYFKFIRSPVHCPPLIPISRVPIGCCLSV